MTQFGEEGRRLDYGSYLAVEELLGLQRTLTGAHDELLFIVVHQVYELWFKVLLHELEAARDHLLAGSTLRARHELRRVEVVERLLVDQVDVMETMNPQEFAEFRSELAPASGFQSVQFREIEFLSGLRDPDYLNRVDTTPTERARLERRLAEPSLWDAYVTLVEQSGAGSVGAVYADHHTWGELFDVGERLLDHDESFQLWRARHVLMVERQIGGLPGTGGSSGAAYLRSTLGKRFFPELWALRG